MEYFFIVNFYLFGLFIGQFCDSVVAKCEVRSVRILNTSQWVKIMPRNY